MRRAASLAVLLGLGLANAAAGADLPSRLDPLIDSTPALSRAFVGMRVLRVSDGRVLYSRNADRLFIPASNMKLFTTALALSTLGDHYRLTTQIGAQVPIDPSGTLPADLVLVGGGDPTLSGREYPYQSHTAPSAFYSFRAIGEMADQLIARGLKRIDGDIVGDDTRYVWEPQPGPWSSDSAIKDYGAPVSALIVNDNTFVVTIRPASHAGDLAIISLSPPFDNFVIDNRVITTARGERKIEYYRSAGGNELHVWGSIPKNDGGYAQELAVGDPALYAAQVLRTALLERGVSIGGSAVAEHRFPDQADGAPATLPFVFVQHQSPALFELLQVVDKVSQNLHAEMFLREVAVASGRPGSREAGLAVMHNFLAGIGIASNEYQFSDGSGLSRDTLVAPSAITKLLQYMDAAPHRDEWFHLLPIGGEDGTLETRFQGHPEARAIHAKTGTLDHVKALSGYADSHMYGRVAFSLIVNNFEEPSPAVTKAMDELVLALLDASAAPVTKVQRSGAEKTQSTE